MLFVSETLINHKFSNFRWMKSHRSAENPEIKNENDH